MAQTSNDSYVGKAPLTVCRTSSQGFVQVYAGMPAPDDILPDDAKRLVKEGYLEKVSTSSGSSSRSGQSAADKKAAADKAAADKAAAAEKAAADKAAADKAAAGNS